MKNKSSNFLKQIISLLTTIIKAKTIEMKNKTNAIKTRLHIFNLLLSKKVLVTTINHKLHSIMRESCNKATKKISPNTCKMEDVELDKRDEEEEDDDDYRDLRHSLFELEDEEDELVNGAGSAIDFVRKCRKDGHGFSLEDDIDIVADVFIRSFHRQMRMQKQESFKRYGEMLARGV